MTDYEVGDTARVSVLLGHTGCCQLRGKRDVSEHDERNPAAKVRKGSTSEHQNRACEVWNTHNYMDVSESLLKMKFVKSHLI